MDRKAAFKFSLCKLAGVTSIVILFTMMTPLPCKGKEILNVQISSLTNDLSTYGEVTIPGMTVQDYEKFINQKWVEVIPEGKPVDMTIDLDKLYNYDSIEKILLNLVKYEGVHLYIIGKSVQGRNLYSVHIDYDNDLSLCDGELVASCNINNKEVLMTSAGVHARESAGIIFLVKQLNDLVVKAQSDDYIKALLQNVIFVSAPCINPDGSEAVIAGNTVKKSNANGVDLNRNFPSMNAGYLNKETPKSKENVSKIPGDAYFPGYSLGSEPETRSIMKWEENVVPYANSHVDYHQQGGVIYRVKDWNPKESKQEYDAYSKAIVGFLNEGVKTKPYYLASEPFAGMNGIGGSVTDYASSVALGQSFSTYYGRMVFKDDKGQEIPLMVYDNLDNVEYKPINSKFVTITIEMTRGASALGYSPKGRRLQRDEYYKYNYEMLLINRAELALGIEKVEQIKNQAAMMQTREIEQSEIDMVKAADTHE